MHLDIIGGSGFIGTRLAKRIVNNDKFTFNIIDKSLSIAFSELSKICDVRDNASLTSNLTRNSVVIHLAAEHRDDVRPISLYDDVNVGGARHLCEAARKNDIKKIIFTSSVAVYGFAPIGTDENGKISPFNDYGRTKFEAEQIFGAWQAESPSERCLIIIRPTVVFGERNRGNVYNLLKQIASGRFIMIGKGLNRKSMAYVENLAAFIEHTIEFSPGIHTFNYIDKPDFDMNTLVAKVNKVLGRSSRIGLRLPYLFGLLVGKSFDILASVTGKKFPISAIRVKKFCSNSVYNTAIDKTGFVPPISLLQAIDQTVSYEFVEQHSNEHLFFTE